jgi:hypothetical protein
MKSAPLGEADMAEPMLGITQYKDALANANAIAHYSSEAIAPHPVRKTSSKLKTTHF